MATEIHYGKQSISLYRTYARPLVGLTPIPESPFTGRQQTLFAATIGVVVYGDNFLASYTEGDNREVVATDTMKNFVLREALTFKGSTYEALLYHLGERFLSTYEHMQALHLTAEELPFAPILVPGSEGFAPSDLLFRRNHDDYTTVELHLERGPDGPQVTAHQTGRRGLELIKVTGSSFANFARDGYTTLEERPDRALFSFIDLHWRYQNPSDALGAVPAKYVAAEQVRDLVQVVFHEMVSLSIQHLVYEMGVRILRRFPQLAEVSFVAQNRTWDTAAVDGSLKAFTDPRPGHGQIGLTLRQEDLSNGG